MIAERVEVGTVLDPLFSLRGLAGYASTGYSTLQRYLVDGLPHFRLGRKVLVRRSEFDAWLEQYRVIGRAQRDEPDPNAALRAARRRRAAGA